MTANSSSTSASRTKLAVPRGLFDAFLGDVQVGLEYEFDPGEKEVRYYPDGSGHPGSPPYVQINAVWLGTDSISAEYFDIGWLQDWESRILEAHLSENEP